MSVPTFDEYRANIIKITYGDGYWIKDYKGVPLYKPPFLSNNDEKKIYDMYSKKYLEVKKSCFITLQDFKRRPNDFENMIKFCNNIDYIFSEYVWIIESGKAEPPNLHIHILGVIDNKNAKRAIKIEYNKIFKNDITEKDYYLCKQWRNSPKMPPYEQWVKEKMDYFDNSLKGEHANTIDYSTTGGVGGKGVFFTSLIKNTQTLNL